MNKLNYSQDALVDLDDIWKYITEELKNHNAAYNTINNILDNLENLKQFSDLGIMLKSITNVESDYRYLVCGNYLAFYRVIDKDIYIDRILYSKRNYIRILFSKKLEETK